MSAGGRRTVLITAAPRRLVLLGPLLLAACGGGAPAQTFAPIRYDYLTRLQLNVGLVDIGDPPAPGPLDAQSPAPLGEALRRMGADRLVAGGAVGRAVFIIDEAVVVAAADRLDGAAAVHLDILNADGARVGYAEARVSRRTVGVSRSNLRGALYEMTRQMLDDMNVEFEFQVRRTLRDYLQEVAPAPAPAPVEQQELRAPGT